MARKSKATAHTKEKRKKQLMKRTIQDSVFTNLFKEKKYLIQLYQALHPEDTTMTEDDIVTVTIQNILTDNSYNDLGMLVGDLLLILTEAQSVWSVNVIVRALMYLMQTYNEYFKERKVNLYSSKKVKMPKPEIYIIFTGEHTEKPEQLSLSEEFFDGQECSIEAKVKVIYDGAEGDIINQYIIFTKVCKEQIKLYGRTRKAILETIRICKDRNVLKEYLESRKKEVVDIMITLFDKQEIMERYVESEVAQAVEQAVTQAVEQTEKKAAQAVAQAEKKAAQAVAQAEKKAAQTVAQAEKEVSIRNTIEMCQDFGASVAETIQKLVSKFALSQTTAKVKVEKYWK